MQNYRSIQKLGAGAFGNVELAQDITTKELVAIKKLNKKYSTWEECLQLSQVKALRKLVHPNIIKLKSLIRQGNDAYFVFEYVKMDLLQLMNARKEQGSRLSVAEIQHIIYQLVQALLYIHKQGFIHRDLKPENILLGPDLSVKLIDFGIAREVRSKPPFTEYVATRWYRAPQLLFRFSTYGPPIDIFALGCIIAEMHLCRPLFLGTSEMDQIAKVTSLLGSPSYTWPQGAKQAAIKGINLPEYPEIPLTSVFKEISLETINLIGECLKWNPVKRINASQILGHPFFIRKQAVQLIIKKQFKGQLKTVRSSDKKSKYGAQFDDLLGEIKIPIGKNDTRDEDEW